MTHVLNADERRQLLDGLGRDSLEALVLHLTEDQSQAALEELVESTRWLRWLR